MCIRDSYGIDYAQRYRHLPYIGKVTLLDE